MQLRRREIFETIYSTGAWGQHDREPDRPFSGDGSHDPDLVNAYISTIGNLLALMRGMERVVDIGCGDFAVGARLAPLFRHYHGIDIVRPVIDRNRREYARDGVEFSCRDAVTDPLPDGDVAVVRQIFQHLSNGDIAAIAEKLQAFPLVIVTEHLPSLGFEPNSDQPTGIGTRVHRRSGVVLHEPPFDFPHTARHVLLRYFGYGGVVETTAYLRKP